MKTDILLMKIIIALLSILVVIMTILNVNCDRKLRESKDQVFLLEIDTLVKNAENTLLKIEIQNLEKKLYYKQMINN